MIKNRFFKTRMGYLADLIIAKGVDTTDVSTATEIAAKVSIALTIAASPVVGETVTITINGLDYTYTVVNGDTTQTVHDAIAQLLQTNSQGFQLYSHTGTTSSVFVLVGDADTWNGRTVTFAEVGTTFTVPANTTFAGVLGDGPARDSIDAFRAATDNNGLLWAFWVDNGLPLEPGDTLDINNAKREYIYVWKQADGTLYQTTPIKVNGIQRTDKIAANSGTAQVRTITIGGTVALGQTIHIKVLETTGTILPFPNATYQAKVVTDVTTALADIVTKINADKDIPVTASKAGTVLTLTCKDKIRNFDVSGQIELTKSQPDDLSVITTAQTQKQVYPIGAVADVQELQELFATNNGAVIYTPNTYTAKDLGLPSTNVDGTGATPYGFFLVESLRVETGGVMQPRLGHTARILICIKDSDLAKIASL